MLKNADRLTALETQRFESRMVADELRRSSDEMTRMARTYVVTGDPRFLRYFDQIIAIRNGFAPRPMNYQDIYWDYVIARPGFQPQMGDKHSALERLKALNFSDDEIALLREAKNRSDALATLEVRAFNAIQGRFLGKDGTFSVVGGTDTNLARQLVFGDKYHEAKAGIMEKVDLFFKALNARTLKEVGKCKEKESVYLLIALLLSCTLLGMTTLGYWLFSKDITMPLQAFLKGIIQMENAKYRFDATAFRDDEIGVVAGAFSRMSGRVADHIAELERISSTDPLTGINNRITLDKALFRENYTFERYQTPCALIMIDVDFFKRVNDRFGHLVGDRVLIQIAQMLETTTRKSDVIGRWGGEEFLVICPNTGLDGACLLAEMIRTRIEKKDFNMDGQVTVSLGVADFVTGGSIEQTVRRADDSLYRAKKEGRNRVCKAS